MEHHAPQQEAHRDQRQPGSDDVVCLHCVCVNLMHVHAYLVRSSSPCAITPAPGAIDDSATAAVRSARYRRWRGCGCDNLTHPSPAPTPTEGHDRLAGKGSRLLHDLELEGGSWNAKAAAADATAAALADRRSVGNQDERRRHEGRERRPHAVQAIAVFFGHR